jgi:hypothetical protein
MAEWHPLHQQLNFRRGLEAGGQAYDPPLLPYEKSLIDAIGCTEEEYKQLVRHAMQRQRVRPAEYDHIPDIVNDPVTAIVVNLVVGLLLTAASILLAPKAPDIGDSSRKKVSRKNLSDQVGPSRFNQTTSFDNVSSLAEYGQPIPIPFGRRDIGADGQPTGGLIIAPALVWSRLFAYGNSQAFEGIYVAGQYGIETPDIGGVLNGTQPIGNLGNREYALYWSSRQGNNRPTSPPFAGTEGDQDSGTAGRDIFVAPFENDFCMTYNPQGDTQFGTSTPIHNGTAYRFNWEIISAPFLTTQGEDNKGARDETIARRRKIAGFEADALHVVGIEAGQPGVGRAYARRMGVVEHNGTVYADKQPFFNVSPGDVITFRIDYNDTVWDALVANFDEGFPDSSLNLEDLKSTALAWRQRASDLLTVGTNWLIAGTEWVVYERAGDALNTLVRLRCVAIVGIPQIGLCGTRNVEEPLGGYEGQVFAPQKHIGAAFYALCRSNIATIRPVRRNANAIEFGIRSQVWNRANGLCNFNAVPTAADLYRMDRDDVQVQTPRMDKYFTRTSCFGIWVRPVKEYGAAAEPWAEIPQVFAVQGNTPVNQYNYVRIRPSNNIFYEYRFIPKTGDDIAVNYADATNVVILDTRNGNVPYLLGSGIANTYTNQHGSFLVTTQGRTVTVAEIRANDEMSTTPGVPVVTNLQRTAPTAIINTVTNTNTTSGNLRNFAWLEEVLGDARLVPGQTISTAIQHYKENGDRFITIVVTGQSIVGEVGVVVSPQYVDVNGSAQCWHNITYTVESSTGDWVVGDQFAIQYDVSNRFSQAGGYTQVTKDFDVTAVATVSSEEEGTIDTSARLFERNSQIAEVSHYTELTKSNESSPEHEIVYVNEYIENQEAVTYPDMSVLGLAVKSSGQLSSLNQIRIWSETGIDVYRLIDQDTAPSNLYADLVYYLLTNKEQGVGNLIPIELVDTASLTTTARFLRANHIFWDGVIEDNENLRSFLYDNAALQLCNFTIKNGRFGMSPALPYDSNYEISQSPIAVDQIFTAGNIIDDSLELQYVDADQRTNLRGIVSWRVTVENDLPDQRTALVDWADIPEGSRIATEQTYDLTEFCTNREQALKTARYLLSVRRRITHTVGFKTTPDTLGIQPGSYIKVITEATTYNAAANGAITDAGTLVSVSSIADGNYDALIYSPTTSGVLEQQIEISNNAVTDPALYGTLFTLLDTQENQGIYQVEQLTLDENGLVNVNAIMVPVDSNGVSLIAKDVLTPANFRYSE